MAIIHKIPGLEVYVEVAGERLKEYDVPQDSEDVPPPPELKESTLDHSQVNGTRNISNGYVGKYIEVESATYPCVQFVKTSGLQKDGHHIAYDVQFDDTELEIRHQPPGPQYQDREDSVDSVVVGTKREQRSQRFIFNNLERVEDGNIGYAQTSNVGTIRVSVYHMGRHRLQVNEDFNCRIIECNNSMSEEASKRRTFSHCLGLEMGEKIEDPEPEYYDDFLVEDPRPFAVFDFHYRSQDALIDLGVRTQDKILGELQSRSERAAKDLHRFVCKMRKRREQRENGERFRDKAGVKVKKDKSVDLIDLT